MNNNPKSFEEKSTLLPKIRVKDLSVQFGSHMVLDHINFDVGKGESLVIIGSSGVGKSVLLKCLIGLLRADTGEIEIDGKAISNDSLKVIRSKFGMLFQGAALFDSLKVWENVAFGLIESQGMSRTNARELAVDNLAKVGLGKDVADLSPHELSGGMKKRVGLARAIATKPEILFFDEPTTGLDPIMSDVINNLIVKSVNELGATAISITHDMSSLRKIASTVAMLHNGKIVWSGKVSEIDQSKNDYVEQFIRGSSEGPIQMENILR